MKKVRIFRAWFSQVRARDCCDSFLLLRLCCIHLALEGSSTVVSVIMPDLEASGRKYPVERVEEPAPV